MKFYLTPVIRQYGLVVTVNLAVLTTGMSLVWASPSLVKLQNEFETPLSRPITDEEGSWVVAGGFLIGPFINIIVGMTMDRIGRNTCILLLTIPKLCGAIALIFANEIWMIILCRIIMTVVDTLTLITVPIYASEMANKEHRGSLGTLLQFFSSLGVVFTLSVGPFLSYSTFSIVLAIVIAALTVPILFLPDTPFHLYSKGYTEEAIRVLTVIRGSQALAKEELEEYIASSKKTEKKLDKADLFRNKTFLKALGLGFLIGTGSQLIGSNAINYYLQTILESTKTSVPSEIASVIIGVIQLLASVCATLIMRKFGRRTIMLTTLVGFFLGMMGLGTFFQISGSEGYEITGFMNYLPIVSLILIVFCFSVGIGSLMWIVISELFEGPSRAVGVSTSLTSATILIFITTKYFAFMTSALGPAPTYWFFSLMSVLLFILIAIFLPETKGKSFSEIQIALGAKVNMDAIEANSKNNV
ncbi:unnamed protein product, partial [Brenthis ino]